MSPDIAPGEITTRMEFHMSGAQHQRVDRVYIGGEPTEIVKAYLTEGRDKGFKMLAHEMVYRSGKEDEEFIDLLNDPPSKEELEAWIRQRAP